MDRPITILHVVISLDAGGMETVLVNVAEALARRRYHVYVCCLERAGQLAGRLHRAQSVRVLDKPPGKSWRTVDRLRHCIREIDPDIVHTHNLGPLLYTWAARIGGRRPPILHGEHCQLAAVDLSPTHRWLRRWLWRGCRRVHTVSAGQRDQLVALGCPPERLTAIVNGVDTDRFHPANRVARRRELGLSLAGPVLGIVASLTGRKRHALLFRAIAAVVAEFPKLVLAVVGEGPERTRLESLAAELGIARHVVFAGYQDDPLPWLQSLDLMVMPSRAEGLSNAVLEAMACGVPVLSHRACGSAEAIDDGRSGWIADIESPEPLATELGTILHNSGALQRAGEAARDRAIAEFPFDATVKRYARVYGELVEPGR